ncbi:MAG: molybdopterin-dependent oxidoreductase, partial [Pseudomonadales bacterium]|nr:molybdopterin-dependent oxidoreductase [Pseudomonadales bacterium]
MKPHPHESAKAHVTGKALYVDDVALPGDCLYVVAGVSKHPKAKLLSVDLQHVWCSEGVVDVLTAADIPGENEVGAVLPGDTLLAEQHVEYVAQPIFAVAATSLKAAQRAVQKAQIQYDIETPTLSVAQAMAAQTMVSPTRRWGNEQIAEQLAQAHYRVDQQLYIRGQEHFYLEPQASLVVPQDDGLLVVTSSQHPGEVQSAVARVLGWHMHKVTVECRRMGGGFGGKETQAAPLACLAALFATRRNKTVKYRMPRHDDMVQTGKRHDFATRVTLACDEHGLLVGGDFELAGKCGYSPDLSDGIVDRAMFHVDNAYFLPDHRIVGHRCKTNTVSNTAFRGFGGPQGMLAMEAAMDSLAYAANVEPLLLRQRNLYRPGFDRTPYQQAVTQFVLPDLISQLETSSDYWARRRQIKQHNQENPRWRHGISLNPVKFGISFTTTHLNQAGALVHLYTDGSVQVNHGGTEMGQGLFTKVQAVV